jgi:hypothetical protein
MPEIPPNDAAFINTLPKAESFEGVWKIAGEKAAVRVLKVTEGDIRDFMQTLHDNAEGESTVGDIGSAQENVDFVKNPKSPNKLFLAVSGSKTDGYVRPEEHGRMQGYMYIVRMPTDRIDRIVRNLDTQSRYGPAFPGESVNPQYLQDLQEKMQHAKSAKQPILEISFEKRGQAKPGQVDSALRSFLFYLSRLDTNINMNNDKPSQLVFASTAPGNNASKAVLERCGFVPVAKARWDSEKNPQTKDTMWVLDWDKYDQIVRKTTDIAFQKIVSPNGEKILHHLTTDPRSQLEGFLDTSKTVTRILVGSAKPPK